MNTVHDLIQENGGIEQLPAVSPLQIQLGPDRFLKLEYSGISPSRFPVVGVSVFQIESGKKYESRILLEKTGLGLLPFYLRTWKGEEFQVYRLSNRGRIRKVRRDIRPTLVRIVHEWDMQIDVLLAGGEIIQN